jgi:hypothetical protein
LEKAPSVARPKYQKKISEEKKVEEKLSKIIVKKIQTEIQNGKKKINIIPQIFYLQIYYKFSTRK